MRTSGYVEFSCVVLNMLRGEYEEPVMFFQG